MRKHGVDEALIAVVNDWADTGEALIECADKITFIGSPAVGNQVVKKASETLNPVVFEIGSRDTAVICDDCDFTQVVQIAMRGTFQNVVVVLANYLSLNFFENAYLCALRTWVYCARMRLTTTDRP
ncbi:hypothetical protein SeLEV6574_g08600 [Synchytrium endobioticum]|uniref:Aldehyde dehydrogenase domain-containing protein n=1 Tax=Synchytrium endobioticum TaxID=286115 RepID=A0A507BXT5_9FUNG|nr:hypothetical protein SeLEV6574_g08600 [Synchytrium endobioticum]